MSRSAPPAGAAHAWSLSLHDVAPATWDRCEGLLELVAPYGVPVTLLVVPRWHGGIAVDEDPGFGHALHARLRRGDDAVLHGCLHRDDGPPPRSPRAWLRRRVYTAAEGEFDSIDLPTARARLAEGRARLRAIGVEPRGFVPPAWLLGPAGWAALAEHDFRYTCTRDELVALPSGRRAWAPSLVWSSRSAWRRLASAGWNRRRLAALGEAPLVRVALHPAEAAHPRVLDAWRRLLDALASTRTGVRELDWLEGGRIRAAATN